MTYNAGLRNLVGKIEEEKRLAQINVLRNQSRLMVLVHTNDFERKVTSGEHGTGSINEVWQKWELYQSAWSKFLQKFGSKESGATSKEDGEIAFQDVPWPLIKERASEGTFLLHNNPALLFRLILHRISHC